MLNLTTNKQVAPAPYRDNPVKIIEYFQLNICQAGILSIQQYSTLFTLGITEQSQCQLGEASVKKTV